MSDMMVSIFWFFVCDTAVAGLGFASAGCSSAGEDPDRVEDVFTRRADAVAGPRGNGGQLVPADQPNFSI